MSDKELRQNRINALLKLIVLALIFLGIPIYIYYFHYDFISSFDSVREVKEYLLQYKNYGFLVYILTQVIQIIICVIPGQIFQFAAGYVFGVGPALLLSIIGAVLGSSITFFLARILGHDAIFMLFGKTRGVHYIEQLNTKKGYFALFLFYFIPGFPKDLISYVAGISNLRWLPFIIISTAARILPMLGSILTGRFTDTQQYALLAIVIAIVVVITCLCIKYKEKIIEIGNRLYDKLDSL